MMKSNGTMKALSIGLQGEIFAIDAQSVREILDLVPITEVPNARAFVGGVINVRGRVVPLADLRVMFGMERPEPDLDTRIVVLEIAIDGEEAIAAILADKVYDVADIELASVEEAPKIGMRWRSDYVRGIGKRAEDFIIIPNMDRIFSLEGEDARSEERHAA